MLQIIVCNLHDDTVLSVSRSEFHRASDEGGRLYIGSNLLTKYIPKHINPTTNRDKTSCGCEACISAMFLQYDSKNGG